jgi:tetratricopeptide (TPR) repeat protein
MKQLGLLFGLYIRPLGTMSRLLDEGSPLFGALLVLLVCALFEASSILERGGAQGGATAAATSGNEDESGEETEEGNAGHGNPLWALGSTVNRGPIGTLVSLAVLYAPALLFAASALAPLGGFGMAFRRDFGALLTCVFFVWSATHLPFAIASLIVPLVPLLRLGGLVAFAIVLAPAVQLALGASLVQSALAVLLGFLGLLLTPFLHILASPFLLFYAWAFMSGSFTDVEWSLKARRSQRRYLELATMNPRDAEAHIQLGLIHLRRRQWPEARARFETAAGIDPTDPDARFQLGRLERRDGHYPEAEKHFLAVIGRDARFSHHEIWREFGANYLDAKLYEDARLALERFVAQRAHDPEGLVYLGETLLALGRKDEARARFREAVEAAETTPHYRQHEVNDWRKRASRHLRSNSFGA